MLQPSDIGSLWQQMLTQSQGRIEGPLLGLVKQGLIPYVFNGNVLELYPTHDYVRSIIGNRYDLIIQLQSIAQNITGNSQLTIQVTGLTPPSESQKNEWQTPATTAGTASPTTPAPTSTSAPSTADTPAPATGMAGEESVAEVSDTASSVHPAADSHEAMLAAFSDPSAIDTDAEWSLSLQQSQEGYQSSQFETNFRSDNSYYDEPVLIDKPSKTQPNTPASTSTNATAKADNRLLFEVTDYELQLNPNYTFENFITGNSNRIAVAAARNVASSQDSSYNPLFIYGGSGLGKTHLMHAIGNEIKKNDPSRRILCISSEKFMNDFISAIEYKGRDAFRALYRNVDVLLIDDIQFIQGKKATKDEFFHTFNDLQSVNKQIVLTSDVMPSDMTELEDRLRSRFESGFITSIEPPDLETRIAILRSCLKEEQTQHPNLQVEDEAISFIASNITDNIRSLEGVFQTITNSALIQGVRVDVDFAYQYVKKQASKTVIRQLTLELIQEAVSEYFHIKMTDLVGKSRNRNYAHPRQVAMYLCRKMTQNSFPDIAKAFLKKDHTTAMHAYNKIERELPTSEEIRTHIEEIQKILRTKCE